MMKWFIIIAAIICVWLFLSRFVIMKLRWSDNKTKKVFADNNAPVKIVNVTIGDRNIHYVSTGPDTLPTLVFIHGTPASWFRFEKLMLDREMRKKFRMVAIDRPGFGYSDFGKPMHLQEQCKLILPILESMKNDQPMFLSGHSYGGAVVSQLAANAPGLFEQVIILAGAIDPAQEKEDKGAKKVLNKVLAFFLPGAWRPSNKELSWFKDDLLLLAKDLHKIKEPVVFVHGDKDKDVPFENTAYGKKMMTSAASVKIITLKGAKHQLPIHNWEELKPILLDL
jgi:pimeloyl-ACP methyl ester carboxylesterase